MANYQPLDKQIEPGSPGFYKLYGGMKIMLKSFLGACLLVAFSWWSCIFYLVLIVVLAYFGKIDIAFLKQISGPIAPGGGN